jgi:hypothetical protein
VLLLCIHTVLVFHYLNGAVYTYHAYSIRACKLCNTAAYNLPAHSCSWPKHHLKLPCSAACTGVHLHSNSTGFEVGAEVVYFRRRTQSTHSARVVAVDKAVLPFAYTVQVGQDFIETEAEFLSQPSGELDAALSVERSVVTCLCSPQIDECVERRLGCSTVQ